MMCGFECFVFTIFIPMVVIISAAIGVMALVGILLFKYPKYGCYLGSHAGQFRNGSFTCRHCGKDLT